MVLDVKILVFNYYIISLMSLKQFYLILFYFIYCYLFKVDEPCIMLRKNDKKWKILFFFLTTNIKVKLK